MLAPLAEAEGPGLFLEMAQASLRSYPGFVAALESSTGLHLGLSLDGKLLTAYDPARENELGDRIAAFGAAGAEAEWLDGAAVRRMEPSLSQEVRGAVLLRGQGRVDNRRLSEALERDCRGRGVGFLTGRAGSLDLRHGAVTAVRTSEGHTLDRFESVVLAAGAWSGALDGLPRPLDVRPVKGEMLAFAAPTPPLTRVATAGDRYLIPRETPSGPVVVVGATQEERGFDREVTRAGQVSLEEGAVRLVPALGEAPVVERWAGLRPGSADGLPILGPDPEVPNLCYATGHYRNGVLLAPYTADRIREWWEGRS
jgi:glycine oxidase